MAEGGNLLKRQRHELGQGEGDHLDKKLHGQTGDEKCSDMQGGLDASAVTMVYDMKLRSSVATSAVASTSCTNIPVDGGKEVQSGSQAEPMIIDDEHELGQGEGDHLDKKLHGQTGDEKCSDMQGGLDASAVTMVYDMKLRSSVATSAVASTSCTNIPVDGGKEVQSGSQAEPMIIDDEHESGQGEADHLDKKLHVQHGVKKCSDMPGGLVAFPVTMAYHRKLRSSSATRAVASTSCSNISFDGGKEEVQSGSQVEPMMIGEVIQENRFIDCLKNEQGMEETKISVRRGTSFAHFEIDIMLLPGCKDVTNKQGKNFKTNAKKLLLRCMNAAGNSYGGQVKMDFSKVGFGRQDPIEGLKSFYRDTEQLFKGLHSKEMPVKERTISKCIVVDVPMFKDFHSIQSNIKTPKHQSNEMCSDSEVRRLIKTNIEDMERKNTLKVSRDRLKSFNFKYSSKENAWEEGPDTQFKLMAPSHNSGLVGDMLRPGNKLMFYISSFATHEGGIVLFGVEDNGKVDGQVLSIKPEYQHSFQYICQKLRHNIINHTAWINSNGTRLEVPDNYFSITEHLVTDVPEGLKLTEHEYLAVVCVCISKFDGVVFASGSGPEAYKIDPEKLEICQMPLEKCWKNLCTEYKIDKVTKELKQMRLNFHSASDKATIFELDNNASKIREKLFKISPEFPIYPEGLIVPPNGRKIQELFRRNANDEGIILAEKETRPSAVYLLVVSKQYGIHFYMLPIVSGLKSDLLEEQCQKKAIALKTSLCCIGGCRANLVIKIHLVQDNMPEKEVEIQLLSHLEKQLNNLQEDFIKGLLESYIKMVGSFENKALTKAVGVQILNVLTDKQFETLTQMYHCRELWIHGLAGCGKTILARQLMKRLVESGEGDVLYITENKGLASLMSQLVPAVTCMTRWTFVSTDSRRFSHIRNIVMDEVHHYRKKKNKKVVDWLAKARKIVADNRPPDSYDEGYLWLFLDMYQKENNFLTGIPPIYKQKPRYSLTDIVRNTGAIWRMVKQQLEQKRVFTDVGEECTGFYREILHESSCPHDTDGQEIKFFKSKGNKGDTQYIQVDKLLRSLKEEHWLEEDIAILFSTEKLARSFRDKVIKLLGKEMLIPCTADSHPGKIICDSVRRFSGLDRPCVILVEPSVEGIWHDSGAFLALGMSRAMVNLIVIEKLN